MKSVWPQYPILLDVYNTWNARMYFYHFVSYTLQISLNILPKQLAAVTSQFRFTSVPPQMCLGSLNKTKACHGQVWGADSRPPTTRRCLDGRLSNLLPQTSKRKDEHLAFPGTLAMNLKLQANSKTSVSCRWFFYRFWRLSQVSSLMNPCKYFLLQTKSF